MKLKNKEIYDSIIIGGGFYGSVLACYLKKRGDSVLLVEKESDLLKRASYGNQARIHNGYHYPRSFLTAYRSHQNYLRFIKDFKISIYDKFAQYYAIASTLSKTTSQQFYKFSKQLGAFIRPAPDDIKKLFNPNTVDGVFEVEEVVFDAIVLKKALKERLAKLKVKTLLKTEVDKVEAGSNDTVKVFLNGKRKVVGKKVFNCAYSEINKILERSNLIQLPFKQEFIEMPLIEVPDKLKGMSVSIFDGPFFGFLPFPSKNCHSIWHVRYSIRANWLDPIKKEVESKLQKLTKKSNWNYMKKDAQRFLPSFKDVKYLESIYEIKTVLAKTEESDARPILFRKDYGIKNFHVVLGSKIDNIYDVISEVGKE